MANLNQVHFIYGSEPFLIDEHVDKLKSTISSDNHDYFSDQFDLDELKMSIQSIGMFNPEKCIILKNPWFIFKSVDTKISKEIQSTFSSITEPLMLIIYHTKAIDQRNKHVKFLKSNANVHVYEGFKDWEGSKIAQWITTRFKQNNKTADRDVIDYLESSLGHDLRLINSTIQTLCIYVNQQSHVNNTDLAAVTGGQNTRIFQLSESIKFGKFNQAIPFCQQLLNQKTDAIYLLTIITNQIRLCLQIKTMLAQGTHVNTIASDLKKNPYFIQRFIADIKPLSLSLLTFAFEQCFLCDTSIKTGASNPANALKTLLINIANKQKEC